MSVIMHFALSTIFTLYFFKYHKSDNEMLEGIIVRIMLYRYNIQFLHKIYASFNFNFQVLLPVHFNGLDMYAQELFFRIFFKQTQLHI